MFVKLLDDGKVIAICEADDHGAYELPDHLAGVIEEGLYDKSLDLFVINGDLVSKDRGSFWRNAYASLLKSIASPDRLEVNHGDVIIAFAKSDLHLISMYGSADKSLHQQFTYIDLDDNVHRLSTYEWANVRNEVATILSSLAELRASYMKVTVDSRERYDSLHDQITTRVSMIYGERS